MALFIRDEEVRSLLTMADTIDAVERAFRLKAEGGADNRPRQRPRLEASMLQVMPGAVRGMGLGLKAYSVASGGVRFLVLLWDDSTGELLALIEASELGRIRTGAASGVATKYLARRDATSVGLFGTGYQAGTQLEAVCSVRAVSEAVVYSRNDARRRAFAEEQAARLGIPIHPAGKPADAASCDIVITMTNAADPLFAASELSAGAHINAAGSNRVQNAEIEAEVFRRASRVFIDDRVQGRSEAGDLVRAVGEGAVTWDQVEELSDLVGGRSGGRSNDTEITLFESLGVAIEDIAAARLVYDRALERGAGEKLPESPLG